MHSLARRKIEQDLNVTITNIKYLDVPHYKLSMDVKHNETGELREIVVKKNETAKTAIDRSFF